ncbi:hypothetical protein [Roseiarcus sp.]|uniref:hypothetical protein n=1 Tax=Roseiarcus sp. TaxID=1969460 RepID=UPI003F9AB293
MKIFQALRMHCGFGILLLVLLAQCLALPAAHSQSYWHYDGVSGSSVSYYADYDDEVEVYVEIDTDGMEFDWYADVDYYSCGDCWAFIDDVGVVIAAYDGNNMVSSAGDDEGYEAEAEIEGPINRGDAYTFIADVYADYEDGSYEDGGEGYVEGDVDLGEIGFQTTANVPSISQISVNSGAVGTSGSTQVTGSYLIDDFQYSAVSIGGGVQTSIENGETTANATVDFTIPASGVTTGAQNLTMSNTWGSGSVTFTVGDETPAINGIIPDVWPAGQTTGFTISGSGFGTSPSVQISGQGITSYGIVGLPTDAQIQMSVTVDSSAPNGTATITVTSNGYNGSGFSPAPGNGPSGSGSPGYATIGAIPSCPSSVAISSVTPYNLSSYPQDVPTLSTGIGAVATMTVGPASGTFNGTLLSESLSTLSNSCPTSKGWPWPTPCTGKTPTFAVGLPGQPGDYGFQFGSPLPALNNTFYDGHFLDNPYNLLSWSGVNSCTIVCTQTYSCGGNPLGSFTVTYDLQPGSVGSSAITKVIVSKY